MSLPDTSRLLRYRRGRDRWRGPACDGRDRRPVPGSREIGRRSCAAASAATAVPAFRTGFADSRLFGELEEHFRHAGPARGPASAKHEQMPVLGLFLASHREITVQGVPSGRMQRHHPGLAELGVLDDEAVGGDVVQRQCPGFTDAQPGRRDQTEHVMPGERRDGAGRRHGKRRRQDLADLLDRYQMRGRSPGRVGTEGVARGHLVAFVLGVQPSGECMHDAQVFHRLGLRRRCRCPLKDGLGTNERFVSIGGEPRKALQYRGMGLEPVAELLLHRDEAGDMVGDRCHCSTLPIQGWAISCNIAASVLA